MRAPCRWCRLAGLCISALFHVAVGAAILRHCYDESIDAGGERQVVVSLSMFAVGPELEPPGFHADKPSEQESAAQSDTKAVPKGEPKKEAEPETLPALASKSDPQPEPEDKPESKPESDPELEPEAKPAPRLKSKPEIATKSRSKPRSKPKPIVRRPSRPTPRHATVQQGRRRASASRGGVSRSPRGSSKISPDQKKLLEKEFLAGLRRAIANKRRYPTNARRTGKTGTATVYFVLDRNGRIRDARLDKSSGSSALDQAAVDTLRRLARYKPIPQGLGRSKWPLRVPIRFALE